MLSRVKLEDRMQSHYKSLAQAELLTEKQQKKLYSDIKKDIARMSAQAEEYKESYKLLEESAADLSARLKDTEKSTEVRRFIQPAPANNTIDYMEERSGTFAKGMNFYKLFIILFSGSFGGIIVELFWCFLRHGHFESRSGLVWGPFNLVYGIGALMLTICLFRYRNKSSLYSFIGGFITGSVVEYFCSYFQELFFGSVSWDYSNMPFNLNGRICLVYSMFWGILGVLWIKNVYPRIAEWVLKIPNKIGKTTCYVLMVFLIADSLVSAAAVYRWKERVDGLPASNTIERVMDDRFPNERLEKIYANLVFS